MRRGDIGVRVQTVTPLLASGLNLARDHGVVLADVTPGGAAAVAGLRPGDLVMALDGKPMENGRQLQVNLYRRSVGELVSLDLFRDGQPLKVSVAVTERKDPWRVSQPRATRARTRAAARRPRCRSRSRDRRGPAGASRALRGGGRFDRRRRARRTGRRVGRRGRDLRDQPQTDRGARGSSRGPRRTENRRWRCPSALSGAASADVSRLYDRLTGWRLPSDFRRQGVMRLLASLIQIVRHSIDRLNTGQRPSTDDGPGRFQREIHHRVDVWRQLHAAL